MSMDSNCLLSTINDQTIGLQTPLSGAENQSVPVRGRFCLIMIVVLL